MIGVWNYKGYGSSMMTALKTLLARYGITMEYTEVNGERLETNISFKWENGASSTSSWAYIAKYQGSAEETVYTCVFNTDPNKPFVTITNNSSINDGEISNTSSKLGCLLCGNNINDRLISSWVYSLYFNLNVVCNIPQTTLSSGVTGRLLVTNLVSSSYTDTTPMVAKNIYIISNGYKLTPNQVLVDSTGTKKMLSVGSVFLVEYNDEEIVVL